MIATTETAAAFDAGRASAEAEELELGKYWIVPTRDGIEQIDLTGDAHRDYPRRIRQTVHLTHVDSLTAYWDKHSDTASEVYADRTKRTITAILDAHHPSYDSPNGVVPTDANERPRWQTHRAVLTLTYSDPIKAWLDSNNSLFTQSAFAEFVEDWMGYITDPEAADLVEMAQSFQATTKANFKSAFKLINGQRQLEYTEQIDATSSVKGATIAVPTSITLRLPVWRGANTNEDFTARLRYRVNHNGPGQLGIGYKLDRVAETLDAAFEAEIAHVEEHVGRPVLRGTPAGA
jgi:uncharacterized protein YfdQ (DUF2303 family)